MPGWLLRWRIKGLVNGAFFDVERAFRAPSKAQAEELLRQALKKLDQALVLYPYQPHAFNEKSFIYSRLGNAEQALACAREALVLAPDEPKFLNAVLGALCMQAGQSKTQEEARAGLSEAQKLAAQLVNAHPDYPPGHLGQASVLAMAGYPRENWEACLDRAADAYQRARRMGSGQAVNEDRIAAARKKTNEECLAYSKWFANLPAN